MELINEPTWPLVVKYAPEIDVAGEKCRVQNFLFEGDTLGWGGRYIEFIEGIGTTSNGCLPIPYLDNIAGTKDNTYYPGVQSGLNRVFDDSGEVIYGSKYAPPANDGFVPMIREGRLWVYAGGSRDEIVYHYMKFDGVQNVGGTEYHRFVLFNRVKTDMEGNVVSHDINSNYVFYLKEEPGKVYALCESERIVDRDLRCYDVPESDRIYSEVKIYDFTLEEGTEWDYELSPSGYVESGGIQGFIKWYDPVEVGGELCMSMGFSNIPIDGEYDVLRFIEGIGPTCNGHLAHPCLDSVSGFYDNGSIPSVQSILLCVYEFIMCI